MYDLKFKNKVTDSIESIFDNDEKFGWCILKEDKPSEKPSEQPSEETPEKVLQQIDTVVKNATEGEYEFNVEEAVRQSDKFTKEFSESYLKSERIKLSKHEGYYKKPDPPEPSDGMKNFDDICKVLDEDD